MKKKYIAPSIEVETCEAEEFLTGSGVYSEKGIGYGGVDENGNHEADSRRSSFSSWEDSFEE